MAGGVTDVTDYGQVKRLGQSAVKVTEGKAGL